MLKTLIFDLGRVIVPFDFDRGYRNMADLTGLSPADVRERLQATGAFVPYESGAMESAEFVKIVGDAVGRPFEIDHFQQLWGSIFLPDTLLPESLFARLKGRYRLVLLSNTNDLHFRFILDRYPLLQHFDEYVVSYKAKAMKPDPRIYAAAIAAAGCQPHECFFTDDIADYVAGAQAAGIQAVQFTGHEPLLAELRARGVEV